MRGYLHNRSVHFIAYRYNPAYAGILSGFLRTAILEKIQPAYAGILSSFRPCHGLPKIQPRVCGDTRSWAFSLNSKIDTTPRMRGYYRSYADQGIQRRYNPAYAGILMTSPLAVCKRAIQPRVCGDTSFKSQRTCSMDDTTPRMRGYCEFVISLRLGLRYNPAYAGILTADE